MSIIEYYLEKWERQAPVNVKYYKFKQKMFEEIAEREEKQRLREQAAEAANILEEELQKVVKKWNKKR